MTNAQKWTALFMSFVLVLVAIVGGYAYGSLRSVERTLALPATTNRFDVDADIMLTAGTDGELQLEYIHLNRIEGEVNSRILDLILLAANSR